MDDATQLWMDEPEDHDYDAAEEYLSLVFEPEIATKLANKMRDAPLIRRKAKDLLRASRLPLLDETNPHVARDLKKIRKGKPLSPVLLVRGNAVHDRPLIVADGYHRICASWLIDEDAAIPCRIVSAAG
jgi:hypothetical protein